MYFPSAPKTKIVQNERAWICYSNTAEGYITVECLANNRTCKIEMTGNNDIIIFDTYNRPEVLPLMFGNGKYRIRVMVQSADTKYAVALSTQIDAIMRDPDIRFRYPNQRVNYTRESKAVAKAVELCRGANSEADKLSRIYSFIIDNFTYDHDLAANVKARYLPDCDRTLARRKGICCDIAELFTVMCRSQGLLNKYVTGYTNVPDSKDPVYHAYNRIYINSDVTLSGGMAVKKNTWVILDPTFAAHNNNKTAVIKWIANSNNYADKHLY